MPGNPKRGMRAKTNKEKAAKAKPKTTPKKVKPKKDPMKKTTKVALGSGANMARKKRSG